MGSETVAPEEGLLTFRCSEGGVKSCDWETTAINEDLLIFQVEQHARNRHNLVLDEAGKDKIRALLRPASDASNQAMFQKA